VNRLPDEIETIPELFQALGYRTFGVSANRLVGFEVGFDGGFERFVSEEDLDAAAVNAHVLDWLIPVLHRADERPWFVYLHYFDPHDNYRQREPWYDVDGLEAPGEESASRFARFRAEIRRAPRSTACWPPTTARSATWTSSCATSSPSSGTSTTPCVVVTADHGEEFLDHGNFGHGQNLHDEQVHVPLVLRLAGESRPRGRIAENVSTMDLLPTFRALLDLPPSPRDQSRSLLEPRARDRLVCSARLHWPGPTSEDFDDPDARSEEFSAVSGREKLIFSDTRDHSEYRLFDMDEDPGERRSLAGERPARVLELRAAVDRLEHDLSRWERHFENARIDQGIPAHMAGIGYAGEDGSGASRAASSLGRGVRVPRALRRADRWPTRSGRDQSTDQGSRILECNDPCLERESWVASAHGATIARAMVVPLVVVAAAFLFLAERLRPGRRLPFVRGWYLRVLLLNGVQVLVISDERERRLGAMLAFRDVHAERAEATA
jgi:hypothetical protein